ncbi:PREDICTED: uncharacterized protein LOC104719477 [Camelina sativa]|uniref:Uncharacterized protein LOC104719477 n=1 Tax=Camelina sativa TaxID=90675 RepID=A0ABM1QJ31_CAMSA|nr:PREDICTED: uncharacterized protein LOC104719477 [Camelina sativa]
MMAHQALLNFRIPKTLIHSHSVHSFKTPKLNPHQCFFLRCEASSSSDGSKTLRTCKNCKSQFDPLLNHPRACRFHTSHFAGETKRKFESVYTGGTMDTPNSGKVLQYWHCCGSEDPFDSGCTASPHATYDDD